MSSPKILVLLITIVQKKLYAQIYWNNSKLEGKSEGCPVNCDVGLTETCKTEDSSFLPLETFFFPVLQHSQSSPVNLVCNLLLLKEGGQNLDCYHFGISTVI